MKYFDKCSGVYFERENNELWIFKETEPISLIHKKTLKLTMIKRYNIESFKIKKDRVAIKRNIDLIYIGTL